METEKFQQEVEKERQEKKKLESEFIQQQEKNQKLEFLQQLGKNSESQSEIDRESQWEKQLELEQAPLPELPEAQLIYRNQENQSGSLPNGQIVKIRIRRPVSEIVWSSFADDGSRKISAGGTKKL